jgi:hypothetical protein
MKNLKSLIFLLTVIIFSGTDVKKVAEDIKKGKIDVGGEYGMEIGQRYHKIHSEILGIDCEKCHIEKYEENYLYQRKYKLPEGDAPGVVKREVCIKCHKLKGPASLKLYNIK